MKILDHLHEESILTDLTTTGKKEVIDELSLPLSRLSNIDHRKIAGVLMERERLGSTGIGGGIGIPHGKIAELENLLMGFGISRKGVKFDAMDGKPVHIFFLLLSPDDATGLHLMLLARISRLLKDRRFREDLEKAMDPKSVMDIIAAADSEK